MKLQARIGLVFGIFSLLLVCAKVLDYYNICGSLYGFLTLERLSFILYTFVFFASVFWEHPVFKIAQISILAFEAFLTFSYKTDHVAGFIILITLIYILIAYRMLKTHRILKIAGITIAIYIVLATYSFRNAISPWLSSLEWTMLIGGFFFLFWITFKDYIDKLRKDKERILEVAEEAASIARDAIELEKGK